MSGASDTSRTTRLGLCHGAHNDREQPPCKWRPTQTVWDAAPRWKGAPRRRWRVHVKPRLLQSVAVITGASPPRLTLSTLVFPPSPSRFSFSLSL